MTARTTTVVLDGLAFPEGPRWHDGRLWFSDQHDKRVVAMSADGTAETIVEVPQQPSGLGWLPDGRLLVVSMLDRTRAAARSRRHARRARRSRRRSRPARATTWSSTRHGRAYVGNFGFDMYAGEKPQRRRASSRSSPTAARTSRPTELGVPERLGHHPRRLDPARRREHGEPHHRVRHRAPTARSSNRRVWAQLAGRDRRRHVPRRRRRGVGRVPVHRTRVCASARAARSSTR